MSKYDFDLNLNENDSITKIVNRIQAGSRVLEFGCAEGRMTKYLKEEKKCTMSIVEIDKDAFEVARQYAEKGICADLEQDNWMECYDGEVYDYLTFTDVLEHLRNPEKVLEKVQVFLKDEGSVLVSIPNIAHNKILAKLFANHMDYTDTGLLDNTHLKFWGYNNLEDLAEKTGYKIVHMDITCDDNWGGDQSVSGLDINSKFIKCLNERQYGNAYQFIFELKKKAYCQKENIEITYGDEFKNSMRRQTSVFFDMGDGYSQENSKFVFSDYVMGSNLYMLNIPVETGAQKLRFDPIEGVSIFCRVHSVLDAVGNSLSYRALNGYSYEGLDIFETTDPQYEILLENCDTSVVSILYGYSVVNNADIDQIHRLLYLAEKLKHIEFENNELENQKKAIKEHNDNLLKELDKVNEHRRELETANNELHITIDREKISYTDNIKKLEEKNRQLDKEIRWHKGTILDMKKYEQKQNDDIAALKGQIDLNMQQIAAYKEAYEAVLNSDSWHITKPIRFLTGGVRKARRYLGKRRKSLNPYVSGIGVPIQVAVHLHLYYEDLLEEFCGYFNNITEPFDLFISCKQGANQKHIRKIASKIERVNKITIKETPNRGRDIAPFYVLFRDELVNYKCLLHVHSKKSLYTGEEKVEWRHWALDGVLKSKEAVSEMLRLLLVEEDNGLVYGEMTNMLPLLAFHWLRNVPKGSELLSRMGIKFENEMLFYPVGSFFWVKTDAIRPLFDLKLTYDDFDEEHGQIDGTLAHALERVIAYVTEHNGYNTYIYDPERNVFSKNISYRSFEDYFGYNVENNVELFKKYDVISFDIFDTLITRLVYKPGDVHKLMERLIREKYGLEMDFVRLRCEAEQSAWSEKGDYCNIHNIYEKIAEIAGITREQAEDIKKLEIDLEYELCVPRRDAREVFNRLVKANKKIILVSDMYLTKPIIEKMLKKCGYEGYSDIWISCEKGLRKDRETMWKVFFEEFGNLKTIHIGDNPHSDCQIVGDMNKTNMLWLSPRSQFKFSKQYEVLKKYEDTTIENSLMLGYFINNCMYNSPFALKGNGSVQLDREEDVAKAIFAPVFLVFAEFITNTSAEKLLFLSREGYFLQKLYKEYCNAFGVDEVENVYFYTSRRAAAVPQIEDIGDVREILQSSYEGRISVLLKERLGMEYESKEDDMVKLPDDIEKIIEVCRNDTNYMDKIVAEEREIYTKYFKSVLGEVKPEDVAVVDVGYAGTIQYYLIKLCKGNIKGYYLATEYNIKPEKVGGECYSIYSFGKDKVFEYAQLFLEAVTAAPHGQVIRMKEQDGKFEPVMKDENETCYIAAKYMQEEIYKYIRTMGKILGDTKTKFDKNLAADILAEILRPNILSSTMQDVFTVHDNYCKGDGEWKFDSENNEWVLSD